MGNICNHRLGVQAVGLQALIDDLPANLIMLEIGSYAGYSADMFMRSGKVAKLYCIDPWVNNHPVEHAFDLRVETYGDRVVKLKGRVDDFIEGLPKVDFVYIDGDHSYDAVKNDIVKVMTKLKPGGIISGHDYNRGLVRLAGVPKAVDEVLGSPDKIYEDTSWVVIMNNDE